MAAHGRCLSSSTTRLSLLSTSRELYPVVVHRTPSYAFRLVPPREFTHTYLSPYPAHAALVSPLAAAQPDRQLSLCCSALPPPRTRLVFRRPPCAMVALKGVLVVLLVLAVAALSATASSIAGGDHMQLGIFSSSGGECRGTVGECGDEDAEGELGSASAEAHRRVLAGGRYISYGALRRGTVPCSRRGASYYNCRPGAQANPYHRGCSRITRCRG